jgi:lipid II:glycine glycyltransferase (peptidoglycan interpeptide bridge formation enzyme)
MTELNYLLKVLESDLKKTSQDLKSSNNHHNNQYKLGELQGKIDALEGIILTVKIIKRRLKP